MMPSRDWHSVVNVKVKHGIRTIRAIHVWRCKLTEEQRKDRYATGLDAICSEKNTHMMVAFTHKQRIIDWQLCLPFPMKRTSNNYGFFEREI